MKGFEFVPDFNNIVMAVRNQAAPRMPLYEHIVGGRMMKDVIGVNPYEHMQDPDDDVRDRAFADFWRFWRTMGYDTASYECRIGGILPGGGALGGHVDPVIKTRENFEKYPWDDPLLSPPATRFRTMCPLREALLWWRPSENGAATGWRNDPDEFRRSVAEPVGKQKKNNLL